MIRLVALTLALLAVFLFPAGAGAADDKITICHQTHSATNPAVTITISANAWGAHEKHGDTMGPCPTPTATPTPTLTPTPTPTPTPTVSPAPAATPTPTPTPATPSDIGTWSPGHGGPAATAPGATTPAVKSLPSTSTK